MSAPAAGGGWRSAAEHAPRFVTQPGHNRKARLDILRHPLSKAAL